MGVNLFYNYYAPNNPLRASEVLSCLAVAIGDREIDAIFLIGSRFHGKIDSQKIRYVQGSDRPTFAEYFDHCSAYTGENDVNIFLNSDCFLDPRTSKKVNEIRNNEAYCITRHELKQLVPLKIDHQKTNEELRLRRYCMQDAWILRGKPREGMWLDFQPGKPGCDNRIAYELSKVGYRIGDPFYNIRLIHSHSSGERTWTESERIPPPYAYPPRIGGIGVQILDRISKMRERGLAERLNSVFRSIRK
jgi:hypothetical protein